MAVDVDQWLEQWVEAHLRAGPRAADKAAMHDLAKACAERATADGIPIAALKQAADGDLETYLLERQTIATERGESSRPA